jgi:hypothetical protein
MHRQRHSTSGQRNNRCYIDVDLIVTTGAAHANFYTIVVYVTSQSSKIALSLPTLLLQSTLVVKSFGRESNVPLNYVLRRGQVDRSVHVVDSIDSISRCLELAEYIASCMRCVVVADETGRCFLLFV